VILGRRKGVDFIVLDAKASRDHVEIIVEGDRLKVRDLKSRNGTLLNGRKIELDEALEGGDHIRIGDIVIEYVDAATAAGPPNIPGYEIIERIGPGAMGSVYKAKQVSMDRVVALKVLNEKYSKNEAFVSRFLREAQGAAQLSHPNIIHVHDTNYTGKTYYISMEFVDGTTVANMIRRLGKIDVNDTISVALQTARALGFAHGKKVIHRDIRPGTIMVTRAKEAKIADLGLAKSFDERVGDSSKPTLSGTPHYMAPEQAIGEPADARSDIYSLGATMYHMLTGNVPFQGDSVEKVLEAHTTSYLPAIQEAEPEVPDSIAALVARMMARDASSRYQSMADVVADLEKIKSNRGTQIKKVAEGESSVTGAVPAVVEKKRRRAARRRIIKRSADIGGIVAALIVAIAAVIAGLVLLKPPSEMPRDEAARAVSPTARTGQSATYKEPDLGWNEPPAAGADADTAAKKLDKVGNALDRIVGVEDGAPVAAEPAPAPEPEPAATEEPAAEGAPAVEQPAAEAPAAVDVDGDKVTRHLGYCRPDTWEKGKLTLKNDTTLTGTFLKAGDSIRFKAQPDAQEQPVAAADVVDVEFHRPNNIDASMGDFVLKQGKTEDALKRFEKALKSEPGHPYLRIKVEQCQKAGGA
jgi:hypothetical protein